MILFINKSSLKLSKELKKTLNNCKNKLTTKNIELMLVNAKEIKELNNLYLGNNYETDVLSFPLNQEIEQEILGSVVINIDLAKKLCEQVHHSLNDELSILLIHGTLHLLNYDHENDHGEFRLKEQDALKELGINLGLIDRTYLGGD